tara:strand:- start:14295 stop:15713 length:1419 start_codon:yes stop_codon:yes gene_type:complete
MKKYKVAIIGAGTAGLSARQEVAKITDDYVVIDSGPLGTTCARVGCMPSKALIQIANDYTLKKVYPLEGIIGADNLSPNYIDILKSVRKKRDRFVNSLLDDMSKWQNKLINKQASFVDAHILNLGDEKIYAEKIIIATGSKPLIPKDWEKYQKFFIDTNDFFDLENFPNNLLVIGIGVIGLELGQALHNLDLDLTLAGPDTNIGGISDPQIKNYIKNDLKNKLNVFYDRVNISGISKDGKLEVNLNNKILNFDKALLAVGRIPNVDNLNLDKLEVDLNAKGIPSFNDSSFNLVHHEHIFITGDVNAKRQLLHEAADQGRIAGYNAVREELQCFKTRTLLSITFTDPNIALLGQTYKELTDKNIEFVIGEVSYEGQGRSIIKNKEKGLLHIYISKDTGVILGAELYAPEGEHLAHLLSWAVASKMTIKEALAMPFYHPVLEEGIRTALQDAYKKLNLKKNSLELFRCNDMPIR